MNIGDRVRVANNSSNPASWVGRVGVVTFIGQVGDYWVRFPSVSDQDSGPWDREDLEPVGDSE